MNFDTQYIIIKCSDPTCDETSKMAESLPVWTEISMNQATYMKTL